MPNHLSNIIIISNLLEVYLNIWFINALNSVSQFITATNYCLPKLIYTK